MNIGFGPNSPCVMDLNVFPLQPAFTDIKIIIFELCDLSLFKDFSCILQSKNLFVFDS